MKPTACNAACTCAGDPAIWNAPFASIVPPSLAVNVPLAGFDSVTVSVSLGKGCESKMVTLPNGRIGVLAANS